MLRWSSCCLNSSHTLGARVGLQTLTNQGMHALAGATVSQQACVHLKMLTELLQS